MKSKQYFLMRLLALILVMTTLTILSARLRADAQTTGTCGGASVTIPFTDVAAPNIFFCSIAAAYFSGLTNGTSATTYTPAADVTREQMAAFVTRTLDQSLRRGSRRAALGEWWTNQVADERLITLSDGHNPRFLACDGLTVWVSNTESDRVSRVDIRTGTLICSLTGVPLPQQIVIVSGVVYVASHQAPGRIYRSSLAQTLSGPMSVLPYNLGANSSGITYDGQRLWTANVGTGPGTGSISRVDLGTDITTTFTTGFSQPVGILFDGVNLWVTDTGDFSLKRVDTNTGAVLQTTALSNLNSIGQPVFDGTNLWIPCARLPTSLVDRVFVVRVVGGLTGTVLATLTGNGMDGAFQMAFDGERICVSNAAAQSVSLWKAADLSPLGAVEIGFPGFNPRGVCSDGTTFFIGLRDQTPLSQNPQGGFSGRIARF